MPVRELSDEQKFQFKLDDGRLKGLTFVDGYEVNCFINLQKTRDKSGALLWHKSQVILNKLFASRTNSGEALFDISWVQFQDERAARDLLYTIHWLDYEVARLPPVDCFEVQANVDVRDQFRRLEANSTFGSFCMRLIAKDILASVTLSCLEHASIVEEPEENSVQARVDALLTRGGLRAQTLAENYQSGDKELRTGVIVQLNEFLQEHQEIGSYIGGLKFGGM